MKPHSATVRALLLARVPVKPMEFYVSNPGCSCRVLQGPASVAIVHGPCHAAKMFKDKKEVAA